MVCALWASQTRMQRDLYTIILKHRESESVAQTAARRFTASNIEVSRHYLHVPKVS